MNEFQHPWFIVDLGEQLAKKFSALAGDPDYVFHEIAHYILLTRTTPTTNADFRSIDNLIEDSMGQGQAQLHELRVIALQVATWRRLGFAHDFKRAVDLSWDGIRYSCDNCRQNDQWIPAGRVIIHSRTQAVRFARKVKVSERLIKVFIATLRRFARELDVRPSV